MQINSRHIWELSRTHYSETRWPVVLVEDVLDEYGSTVVTAGVGSEYHNSPPWSRVVVDATGQLWVASFGESYDNQIYKEIVDEL